LANTFLPIWKKYLDQLNRLRTRITHVVNPIGIAAKGKGYSALFRRARAISGRYGLTPAKMDQALRVFIGVLQDYHCGASFPITASALAHHGTVIERYQAQNIEFPIHGLFHVDYSKLTANEQSHHIDQARQIFHREKIRPMGFRCPYLRWNDDTLTAVAGNDLSYDSSQALHWDVVEGYANQAYEHVLSFYGARSANDYPALPKIIGKIVQIPYCIPDDEALVERLKLGDIQTMSDIWLAILKRTYELAELFTLGLHPERIGLLHKPLAHTLAQARSLWPKVWIARLDEVAGWWRARSQARFEVISKEDDLFDMHIVGPPGATVLARHVTIQAPVEPWRDGFDRVEGTSFRFQASRRPCIGLSPDSDPALLDFLRQLGYWVETADGNQAYSIHLRYLHFGPENERLLLSRLARSEEPLIRLGRWPDGAQSAMCVTGDIDALTLWDYGLRFLGK
jgi:peptidoglycan/xylan/chitin deacetylase (PgdA/CDA1 family)